MPLKLNSSGGGSVTLDVPSTASVFTLSLPAADGSIIASNNSGLVNFSQRPTVAGAPIGINLGTSQNSTSGTTIDFTGIPAGVRRVTAMFRNLSTSGTQNPIIRLGTASGVATTGYLTTQTIIDGGGVGGTGNFTDGFTLGGALAANVRHGSAVFDLMTGNIWVGRITSAFSNTTAIALGGGSVELSDVLTRLQFNAVSDNFDGGVVNISWEF